MAQFDKTPPNGSIDMLTHVLQYITYIPAMFLMYKTHLHFEMVLPGCAALTVQSQDWHEGQSDLADR